MGLTVTQVSTGVADPGQVVGASALALHPWLSAMGPGHSEVTEAAFTAQATLVVGLARVAHPHRCGRGRVGEEECVAGSCSEELWEFCCFSCCQFDYKKSNPSKTVARCMIYN